MAYDPYKDIGELVSTAKGGISAEQVYDILRRGDTFYKSTYGDLSKEIKDTKDYVSGDGAYNDAGSKAIRRTYAAYADRDKAHTEAKIAGENGGNTNTYAAAQANRAARDMLTAGEEAVRERAEGIYDRLLEADNELIQAAGEMTDRLAGSAEDAVKLAESAKEERESALKALLNYYGVPAKAK